MKKIVPVSRHLGSFLNVVFVLLYVFSEGAQAVGNVFTLEEVAKHNSNKSCYMVIEDVVYDATPIMKEHASKHEYDLTKWCGKEATKGWAEKDGKGRPHSRKAGIQLKPLRVGTLAPAQSKP
jgi:cytochrome b involved in lipid metabolism